MRACGDGEEPDARERRRTPLLRPGLHEGIELELEHHVAERTERLMAEGWDPGAARREAERRFGIKRKWTNELVAEARADTGRRWMTGIMDSLTQDIRYALRGALRQPGFTLVLLATLALGIGATGGVFSVIDAVLLRPLPYESPDRLVDVRPFVEGERVLSQFGTATVDPWVEGADFMAGVARYHRTSMVRTADEGASLLGAVVVSHNLDDVLGIDMAQGRGFVPEDVTEDRPVVILSSAYWRQLGADPAVLGTGLELDGTTRTVVGVLAPGVKYPVTGTPEVWVPFSADGTLGGGVPRGVGLVGRLADGVSLEAAQERADLLAPRLAEALPGRWGWEVNLRQVGAWRANADTERGFWLLGSAVSLMLLIALVNSINLLLVRGQGRTGEFGIRKAIGASRARVTRQIVIESLVLSLAAGVVASVVAAGCVGAIGWLAPEEVTFGMVHEFRLEGRALGLVFGIAALSGLLVGLLPGLRLSRAPVAGSGPAAARGGDPSASRLRTVLVTAEIAISVVLLVGAGLFLRSFGNMLSVDTGMAAEEVAIAKLELPDGRYGSGPDRATFANEALARLGSLPGVTSVSLSTAAPPEGGGLHFTEGMKAEDRPEIPGFQVVPMAEVAPGFLETVGAELVAGRDLSAVDVETGGVLVDRDLAEMLFGGTSPVDRRFTLDPAADQPRWLTVVGVVEELTLGGPDDKNGSGAIIYPTDLDAPSAWQVYIVRTSGDPADLLAPMREALHALDDQLPLLALQTGEQAFGEALSRPRFVVLLFSVLAWIALLLSAVGTFGVVSYSVRQRRRETGIRIALGAPASSVRAGILGWGLGMAGVGVAVGVVVALQLDEAAQALLFGVQPGDPTTLVGVAALMLAVTAAACLLPALRATRVDPVEALRSE